MRLSKLIRKIEEDNLQYYEENYDRAVKKLANKITLKDNREYLGNIIRRTS